MSFKLMQSISGVLDIFLGLVLILVPGPITAVFGLYIGPVGQGLLRLLGCAVLALGLVIFQLRSASDPQVTRVLVRSLFYANLAAALLALLGQVFLLLDSSLVAMVESVIGPMPKGGLLWLVLVVLLVMTAGYAYLLFSRKSSLYSARQPA